MIEALVCNPEVVIDWFGSVINGFPRAVIKGFFKGFPDTVHIIKYKKEKIKNKLFYNKEIMYCRLRELSWTWKVVDCEPMYEPIVEEPMKGFRRFTLSLRKE